MMNSLPFRARYFGIILALLLMLAACDPQTSSETSATEIPSPVPTSPIDDSTCPALVDTALETANDVCQETGRNQVCYGNPLVEVQSQPDVESIVFEQPGDIVHLVDLRNVIVSPMDTTNDIWGIALMRLQADVPESLPGQNVLFLLIGDTQFENRGEGAESFFFQSGIGDAVCRESPDSGLLVQTPEGVETVTFTLNGVEIGLTDTAYLQAQPEAEMIVNVLEGAADVTSQGTTQTVEAGQRTTLELNANSVAVSPPTQPEPIEDSVPVPEVPARPAPELGEGNLQVSNPGGVDYNIYRAGDSGEAIWRGGIAQWTHGLVSGDYDVWQNGSLAAAVTVRTGETTTLELQTGSLRVNNPGGVDYNIYRAGDSGEAIWRGGIAQWTHGLVSGDYDIWQNGSLVATVTVRTGETTSVELE